MFGVQLGVIRPAENTAGAKSFVAIIGVVNVLHCGIQLGVLVGFSCK